MSLGLKGLRSLLTEKKSAGQRAFLKLILNSAF